MPHPTEFHSVAGLPVDFLCIGAQKAGTSWLNLNLKLHPRIYIPYLKETFFLNLIESDPQNYPVPFEEIRKWFTGDFRVKTQRHIRECIRDSVRLDSDADIDRWVAPYLAYLFRGLEYFWTGLDRQWYDHLYSLAQPGQVRGDITPDYSLLHDGSVESLANGNPGLKVILIRRDPVARDLSQLKMELLVHTPQPTVDECIDYLKRPNVVVRSDYQALIERWGKWFGDNLLVEDHEAIANEPERMIQRVCRFLGVGELQDLSKLKVVDNEGRRDWTAPPQVVDFLRERYRV
jgi:hypothetical protein